MATYYAMTTTYPRAETWQIVGVGATAREAQAEAERWLNTRGTNIYAQTESKNLTVLSRSQAIQRGFIPRAFDPAAHPAWQKEE